MADAPTRDPVRDDSTVDIRVLLIDDNERWASSTARLLEHRASFAVDTATTPAGGSNAIAEDNHHCIVCDYDLDTGTGIDLLTEMRGSGDDRPFVLITGQGDESVASDAIGEGVTDYIPKRTLSGEEGFLAHRIEQAVRTYRAEQALHRERRSKDAMLDILRATGSQSTTAQQFCDHLVDEHGYDCAWIGTDGERPASATETSDKGGAPVPAEERFGAIPTQQSTLAPQTAAGNTGYLDTLLNGGLSGDTPGEPATVAHAEGEAQVVSSLQREAGGWQAAAVEHGFEHVAAVPIRHDGTAFGVLAVYRSDPRPSGNEPDMLAEYAETIGYTFRSAEWRESLLSPTPVRIDIGITDRSVPLTALGTALPDGAQIELLTTALRTNSLLYLLDITGISAADLRDCEASVGAVEDIEIVHEGAAVRVAVTAVPPTPETVLADSGGRLVGATFEDGQTKVRTVVQSGAAHPVVDAIQNTYPDAGVLMRSTSRTQSPNSPLASLTDKQLEALEVAFYQGYFRRPREHNATEIATKLGVSRHTFAQHLRGAERKVLTALLENSPE